MCDIIRNYTISFLIVNRILPYRIYHSTTNQLHNRSKRRFYREALLHNESHAKARLALVELHILKGELDAGEHECVTLLRTNPENEEATVVCI